MKNFKYDAPTKLNTDQNPAYNQAIDNLRNSHIQHRKVKYLNNIIEQDQGKLKRLIKPMLGFKTMKSAIAMISGYEWMRMFKKGQFNFWMKHKRQNEVQFMNELFGIYAV